MTRWTLLGRKPGRVCIGYSEMDMVTEFAARGRVADPLRCTVNFKLRDGTTEIHASVSFEALQRLARVSGDIAGIAEQLFDRHRPMIETIALARYAATIIPATART